MTAIRILNNGTLESIPWIDIKFHASCEEFELLRDVHYTGWHRGRFVDVFIPKGFRFRADVPKHLQGIYISGWHPKILLAALLHDYGWRTYPDDKVFWNEVFEDLANICGVPKYKNNIAENALDLVSIIRKLNPFKWGKK